MDQLFAILFFTTLPLASVLLCFLKDARPGRKKLLNILLILNSMLFLMPLALAFRYNLTSGGGYGENAGGAAFWYYFFLVPFCLPVFVVLLILKIRNARSFRKDGGFA